MIKSVVILSLFSLILSIDLFLWEQFDEKTLCLAIYNDRMSKIANVDEVAGNYPLFHWNLATQNWDSDSSIEGVQVVLTSSSMIIRKSNFELHVKDLISWVNSGKIAHDIKSSTNGHIYYINAESLNDGMVMSITGITPYSDTLFSPMFG